MSGKEIVLFPTFLWFSFNLLAEITTCFIWSEFLTFCYISWFRSFFYIVGLVGLLVSVAISLGIIISSSSSSVNIICEGFFLKYKAPLKFILVFLKKVVFRSSPFYGDRRGFLWISDWFCKNLVFLKRFFLFYLLFKYWWKAFEYWVIDFRII